MGQGTPTGERERILARLAALQRIKEEVAGRDRPAMFHSVLQLMKLESAALSRLECCPAQDDSASRTGQ